MRNGADRFWKPLLGVATLSSIVFAGWAGYQAGYRAGLADQGPDYRYLVVNRRTPGNRNSSGSSYRLFDLRKPADAANLREEIERLKSVGADYHVARTRIERTINPEPIPRRVNLHR